MRIWNQWYHSLLPRLPNWGRDQEPLSPLLWFQARATLSQKQTWSWSLEAVRTRRLRGVWYNEQRVPALSEERQAASLAPVELCFQSRSAPRSLCCTPLSTRTHHLPSWSVYTLTCYDLGFFHMHRVYLIKLTPATLLSMKTNQFESYSFVARFEIANDKRNPMCQST